MGSSGGGAAKLAEETDRARGNSPISFSLSDTGRSGGRQSYMIAPFRSRISWTVKVGNLTPTGSSRTRVGRTRRRARLVYLGDSDSTSEERAWRAGRHRGRHITLCQCRCLQHKHSQTGELIPLKRKMRQPSFEDSVMMRQREVNLVEQQHVSGHPQMAGFEDIRPSLALDSPQRGKLSRLAD